MVMIMKKIIPVLAILGSAAALVAYKMKKDEQKQIVELDQGLLQDEDVSDAEDEVEEGPISEPQSCCMKDIKESVSDTVEDVKDHIEDAKDTAADMVEDVKEDAKEILEDVDEEFPSMLKEEIAYLKEQAKDIMDTMASEGDVHENERPVQHFVKFSSPQDLDDFKNTVINKGFVITKGDEEGELIVLHITPIDDSKLVPNILYIANEAKKHHGEYKGWNSKVIY